MAEHPYPRCEDCGKVRFPSVHAAREATRTIGNRIRVYASCGGFHITDNERDGGRTGGANHKATNRKRSGVKRRR